MKVKVVPARKIAQHEMTSLAPRAYLDDMGSMERGSEAFARGGMAAYNEVRGHDSYVEEPCGHHCDVDCPRCGEDAYYYDDDDDDNNH